MTGLEFLSRARRFGMKLGLESMRELCSRMGNPEGRLKFIHLAGTNGKGSTAAFLASSLQASGFRVGLYTSPHLIELNERVQINRVPISPERLEFGLQRIKALVALRSEAELPTFFEIMTALALDYFSEEKVDWVVWETGMGGRLDATNVVAPEVAVITQIGRDHVAYLGETLEAIAMEKAGIIKSGVPLISGVQEPAARGVIRSCCEALKVRLIEPKFESRGLDRIQAAGREWDLGLAGEHQGRNAACAVEVLKYLGVSEASVESGLKSAWWPGRFQKLRESPPLVLDGAHNPSAAVALAKTWVERYGEGTAHLVFGAMNDKEISEVIDSLQVLVKRVTLVRPRNERAEDPRNLARHFQSSEVIVRESLAEVWDSLLADKSPILITGSLFLVGEALALHGGKLECDGWRWNERLQKETQK